MDGVSYMLMAGDNKYYRFKGYPDFSVHYESDAIANRILIVMDEVQSTRDLATQNAIYAIGNLLKTPRKELLVLTIIIQEQVCIHSHSSTKRWISNYPSKHFGGL